jgi:L-lactate utilization protein LutB
MSTPLDTVLELRARQVCEWLEKRNMRGVYCETRGEACEEVMKLIPGGALVGLGGSSTLIESGLLEVLREADIQLLDRYKEGLSGEEIYEMRLKGLTADVFISGTNAITVKGQLVNCDGMGNRVASMMFGPRKVIVIAGVNKIVNSIEEGIARVKTYASPMNNVRFGTEAQCAKTGICNDEDCIHPVRMCQAWSVIEGQVIADRLHVVLVGEPMGY